MPRDNFADARIGEPSRKGEAMVWLITLAILVALVHFELWPIAGIWLCYMVATSLTTPDQ